MSTRTEYAWTLPSALIPREPGERVRRTPRDWAVDVTIFALCLGFGVLIGGTDPSTVPQWLTNVDFVFGVLACLAVWLRRRWPFQLALVLAVVSVFSAYSALAALVALFTVAVHCRGRQTAVVTLVNLVAGSLFTVIRNDPTIPWYVELALVDLITAVTVAWGLLVRARRQLVLSLQERAEKAEAEQALRVDQARTLERTRIAREMHDVLAHRISLVSLHAGALEFRKDASPEEVGEAAAVIRASAHQALQDLREVIGVLREGTGEGAPPPQPTLADLPRLLEESRDAGMKIRDESSSDLTALPVSTGRAAYRIVQEGLTNARKHAPGSLVTVNVNGSPPDGVWVLVRNKRPLGARATAIPGAGQGLVGLRERAALAGGRLEFDPDGDDVELRAWLPWPT